MGRLFCHGVRRAATREGTADSGCAAPDSDGRATSRVCRGAGLCYNFLWGGIHARGPEMNAKRYFVSGEVQGVGYRFFAVRVAQRLGISGFVRNLMDGRVEVYAIGDADQHEDLRVALEKGPRAARVSGVVEQDAEIVERYSDSFAIEEE